MSTKIHNGYRLPGATPVAGVARDLAARARPVHRSLGVEAVADVAALMLTDEDPDGLFDALSFGLVADTDVRAGRSVLQRAAAFVDLTGERSRAKQRRVHRSLDRDLSVCFAADPEDPSWTLALLYTERDELQQVWEATEGVEAFGYWNNTDRPADVSEAQWVERREAWDRAIGRGAPAEVGVAWQLHDSDAVFLSRTDPTFQDEVIERTWTLLDNDAKAALVAPTVDALRQALTAP